MSRPTREETKLSEKVRELCYNANRSRVLFVAANVAGIVDLVDDLVYESLSSEEIKHIRKRYIDIIIDAAEDMSTDEIRDELYVAQRIINEE